MTIEADIGSREEIERIRRVSDQLCTAHAALSDRFNRRALLLDIVVLVLSALVTALAFVDPKLLHPGMLEALDPAFVVGVFGLVVFCLTLIQSKTDWRGRGEAHKRSFTMYAEVKREAGYLLASSSDIPPREFQRLAARYDMASDVGSGVPESEFLHLKQKHLTKVEISKLLDKKPGASIWLTKLKLLIRDNWPWSS
ncbi:hypothetical protein [Bradyrhizobium cosmicum]|uniref:hypothetical protein n=1 Tax=Bradyrhizobium cosmicum TaxID=1404864 RepID=UPI0028E33F5E|nr:hypothetical protein [Bradyrhizobium cosmicum]